MPIVKKNFRGSNSSTNTYHKRSYSSYGPHYKHPTKEGFFINENISAREVRIVGEEVESRICTLQEALEIAKKLGVDLIEISPKADPPVCRLMDYGKFKYNREKKQKEMKQKTQRVILKEVRLTPNTSGHDFDFKLRHAKKFLQEGAKVKIFVHFSGREIQFKENGKELLLRFATSLSEDGEGQIESLPTMERRRMSLFVVPKKKKK